MISDYDQLCLTLSVLDEVFAERRKQIATWGDQRLPFHHSEDADGRPLVSQPYGDWAQDFKDVCDSRRAIAQNRGPDYRSNALVLLEEVFEALAETDPEKIRAELLQVAAVAVKAIETLDRDEAERHGPGCERGPYHREDCGPSAVLAEMRRMKLDQITEVPDGIYSTGTVDDADLPTDRVVAASGSDDWVRADAQARMDDLISSAVHPLSGPPVGHPWGGAGRLHGICRCGEGRDAEIHRGES